MKYIRTANKAMINNNRINNNFDIKWVDLVNNGCFENRYSSQFIPP